MYNDYHPALKEGREKRTGRGRKEEDVGGGRERKEEEGGGRGRKKGEQGGGRRRKEKGGGGRRRKGEEGGMGRNGKEATRRAVETRRHIHDTLIVGSIVLWLSNNCNTLISF